MRLSDRIYEVPEAPAEEWCTLYLREGGRFELDRHTGGQGRGTRTTLKGSYEHSGAELLLRTEQKITLEEDPAGDLQEGARTACRDILSARIEEDGAQVTLEFYGMTLVLARLTSRSRQRGVKPVAG